jgi:SAM-dependent methyltransferase
MRELLNIVTPLHQRTERDYVARMVDEKVKCMLVAKQYEKDYWDGDRRYGYGGYRYMEGYWTPVAQALIDRYGLSDDSKVLDVGCGKAFLLYEIKKLLPGITVAGIDISTHGLNDAKDEVRPFLFEHRAQDPYEWGDDYFDLVISLTCLHNLRIFDLEKAVKEIERVGKNKYIMLESYRNEQELFNVQCWALTCEAWFDNEEWVWLYEQWGYTGDYEFIYFE